MKLLVSSLNSVGSLFDWWIGELFSLIPAGVKRLAKPESGRLIAEVESDRASIFLINRNGRNQVRSIDLDSDIAGAHSNRLRIRSHPRKSPATLLIRPDSIVSRNVDLPMAAEENLRNVIGFEIERLTPFRSQDVYFDFKVAKRDSAMNKVTVDLSVSPRKLIDHQIAGLAKAGIVVDRVDVGTGRSESTQGLNLLPRSDTKASRIPDRIFSVIIVLIVFAVGVAAIAVPLDRKARYDDALHQQMIEVKARATQSQVLAREITKLQESGTYLIDYKQNAIPVSEVLDTAAKLLPDHTWLAQLRLGADRLEIEGFSPNSSELISVFEASPTFSDVKFSAPVTQEPIHNLERFGISMRVDRNVGK